MRWVYETRNITDTFIVSKYKPIKGYITDEYIDIDRERNKGFHLIHRFTPVFYCVIRFNDKFKEIQSLLINKTVISTSRDTHDPFGNYLTITNISNILKNRQ